jgi:hydroxyacylglutathione hydrolase
MDIHRLPALRDNYIFLLHDPVERIAAVVDPGEPEQVLQKLKQLNVPLTAIFNTHHHHDHIGANRSLLQQFPRAVVYGGDRDRGRIPGQQVFLKAGDRLTFGDRTAEVLFVPGHTYAHIAYYFPGTSTESGELFCGDTLFAGSCGKLFEGTPAQMLDSLSQFRALPDDTRVWCAHEYTLNNLRFALTVDRDNLALQERMQAVKIARLSLEPTIPSTIGMEKLTNPFLRWDQIALQQATNQTDSVRVFGKLRSMRDLF